MDSHLNHTCRVPGLLLLVWTLAACAPGAPAPVATAVPTHRPVSSVTSTLAPATLAPASESKHTSTPPPTRTPLPTYTPLPTSTSLPTFTPSPTNTPLPPLPGFEEVLSFGWGASDGECEYPLSPNAISLSDLTFGHSAQLCLTLAGGNFARPFRVELIAPNGQIFPSADLWLSPDSGSIQWTGNPGFDSSAYQTSDGTLHVQLTISWPVTFPLGAWQVHAYGDGFMATGDLWAAMDGGRAYISALDPRSSLEIMPAPFRGLHPVRVGGNGAVAVTGINFPPDAPIYVLVYRVSSSMIEGLLVERQSVTSDAYGSISTQLSGPFEVGQAYLLIGLSDPNTVLSPTGLNDAAYPSDFFQIMP